MLKDAGGAIPLFLGDFVLSRFIQHLSRLEDVYFTKIYVIQRAPGSNDNYDYIEFRK
jgi:hypothetical protein